MEEVMDYKTCETVGDLITALSEMPADTAVIGETPDWPGVRLIPQDTGNLLLCSPRLSPMHSKSVAQP
jgi:hypothetical protein